MNVTPGTRLGDYEIVAPLSASKGGHVYHARDTRLGRDVAVRLLIDEPSRDRSTIEQFLRDARAASSLNHPNIVTVYEVGEIEGGRYIVMEFVRGQTLRGAAGTLSPASLVEVATQIARALAAVHACAITHRDIKPENVILRPDGSVKIVDFGLTRLVPNVLLNANSSTTAATGPGVILGTLRYMAPEQARGEPTGTAADIFSFGVVLYELATGYHPFLADSAIGILHAILSRPPVSPSKLNPAISRTLEALILQMLEKDAKLRPTAVEVETRLGGCLEREASAPGGAHY